MTIAAPAKPKTERTIVSMKLTDKGLKSELTASVEKQIVSVLRFCEQLDAVDQYQHYASLAAEGLQGILNGGGKPEEK